MNSFARLYPIGLLLSSSLSLSTIGCSTRHKAQAPPLSIVEQRIRTIDTITRLQIDTLQWQASTHVVDILWSKPDSSGRQWVEHCREQTTHYQGASRHTSQEDAIQHTQQQEKMARLTPHRSQETIPQRKGFRSLLISLIVGCLLLLLGIVYRLARR